MQVWAMRAQALMGRTNLQEPPFKWHEEAMGSSGNL